MFAHCFERCGRIELATMPEGQPSSNGQSRMDRLERLMEFQDHVQFREEHKQLLTAQVVLTDRLGRLAQTLDTAVRQLTEVQRHTDDRLNALIAVVDDLIRKRPPQ